MQRANQRQVRPSGIRASWVNTLSGWLKASSTLHGVPVPPVREKW